MKIVGLIVLVLICIYHLFKAIVQMWPVACPDKADKYTVALNLKFQSRLIKGAITSLFICLLTAVAIQLIL